MWLGDVFTDRDFEFEAVDGRDCGCCDALGVMGAAGGEGIGWVTRGDVWGTKKAVWESLGVKQGEGLREGGVTNIAGLTRGGGLSLFSGEFRPEYGFTFLSS